MADTDRTITLAGEAARLAGHLDALGHSDIARKVRDARNGISFLALGQLCLGRDRGGLDWVAGALGLIGQANLRGTAEPVELSFEAVAVHTILDRLDGSHATPIVAPVAA